jgi:uncharacterized membrane protein (DUF4010 family)
MYVRVLVESFVIDRAVAELIVAPLVVLFVLVEGAAAWWWWHSRQRQAESNLVVRNPVTVFSALQFGLIYGVVAFAATVLVDRVSETSLSIDACLVQYEALLARGAERRRAGAPRIP